jgi:hypothetical protein
VALGCVARWRSRSLAGICADLIHWLCTCAASICETYPLLEETGAIDVLIPKKEPLLLGKW